MSWKTLNVMSLKQKSSILYHVRNWCQEKSTLCILYLYNVVFNSFIVVLHCPFLIVFMSFTLILNYCRRILYFVEYHIAVSWGRQLSIQTWEKSLLETIFLWTGSPVCVLIVLYHFSFFPLFYLNVDHQISLWWQSWSQSVYMRQYMCFMCCKCLWNSDLLASILLHDARK